MESPKRAFKLFLASLFVLGLAWQHIQATRLGYEVEESRRKAKALRGRLSERQMEIERELSPGQLARLAETRLSMVPAPPGAVRRIAGG